MAPHRRSLGMGTGEDNSPAFSAAVKADRFLASKARVVCPVKLCTLCVLGVHVYMDENSFYSESSIH